MAISLPPPSRRRSPGPECGPGLRRHTRLRMEVRAAARKPAVGFLLLADVGRRPRGERATSEQEERRGVRLQQAGVLVRPLPVDGAALIAPLRGGDHRGVVGHAGTGVRRLREGVEGIKVAVSLRQVGTRPYPLWVVNARLTRTGQADRLGPRAVGRADGQQDVRDIGTGGGDRRPKWQSRSRTQRFLHVPPPARPADQCHPVQPACHPRSPHSRGVAPRRQFVQAVGRG